MIGRRTLGCCFGVWSAEPSVIGCVRHGGLVPRAWPACWSWVGSPGWPSRMVGGFRWRPRRWPMRRQLVLVTSYISFQEKKERGQLMQLFSKQVSPDIAQALWEQREEFLAGQRPRSQKLTATVLFTDLKGFSTTSEKMEPSALDGLAQRIHGSDGHGHHGPSGRDRKIHRRRHHGGLRRAVGRDHPGGNPAGCPQCRPLRAGHGPRDGAN